MNERKGAAIVYCRVSTINQAEEGTSLDSQQAACVAHAGSLGYSVGRITQEVYSGAELWDRPKLSQDRADLKTGQFAALVCYSTDRLSRDPIHLAIIAEECERAGVALHFVSEIFDYDDDEAALIRYVKGYSNKKEREKIRERSLRGKHQRALNGKVHGAGSELYGYRRDKARGVRLVYEPEAAIIRQIFTWAAQDRLPVRTVVRRLNDDGVPPPSAGKFTYRDPNRPAPRWVRHQIQRILDHPAYKGEAVAWRWRHAGKGTGMPTLRPESEWVRLPDGVVPAIVSPALWQEAHDALQLHRGETTRNSARPALLRGHIYCGVCGKRMQPMRENSNTTHARGIYRCSSRDTASGACGGKRIPAADVEAWAWERITYTLQNPDLIAAEVARREAEGPDPVLTGDLDTARRQHAACERAQAKLMQRYTAALAEGDSEDDAIWKLTEREINRLEAEKAGYQKTIAQIEKRLADARMTSVQLVALQDYCERVSGNLAAATFDDKRLALAALDIRVTGSGRAWTIRGSIPLDVPEPIVSLQTTTCACCGPLPPPPPARA